MKKLNRCELARQFNVQEDVARVVCIYYNEDEDLVKECLSKKESYLRICRLQKYKKNLNPEDFEKIKNLSDKEAREFMRLKTLEKKHGSLKNFYKEQDEKRKNTLMEKYGRTNSFDKEKSNHTKIERYGDINYNNREKAAKTCIERYGVKSFVETKDCEKIRDEALSNKTEKELEDIKEKRKDTLLERYGDINYNNREKAKQTSLERYGEDHYTNQEKIAKTKAAFSEEKKKEIKEKTKQTFLKKYGVPSVFQMNNFTTKYPGHISEPEQEIRDFLKSLNVEFNTNCRDIISTKEHLLELDMYIPSKKVAIEYDGLYWHSEYFKTNNYHELKSTLCREKGIRLLHIFGDYWDFKKEICKSIIKSALGVYDKKIYARKCELKEIDNKTYENFLKENHIQGIIKSPIRKGLFYNEELVQVIGVGKSRFKKNEYELQRMCTKLNTQVLGGFSKLLKSLNLKSLTTYVDLSLFNGKGYETIGFKYIKKNPPNYWYLYKGCGKRLSRQTCQKHKLKKILGESFDPSLTEVENMHREGYVRIFDSGNLKLIWKNSN